MYRSLQTTEASLGWLISRGIPVIARAEFQETTTNNIDIGRSLTELKADFSSVNLEEVDPIWPAKEGLYEFSPEALVQRGLDARRWLKGRKGKVIAVVSHGGFLRVGLCGKKFENADFRVFGFEDGDGTRLVEQELTKPRGGMGKSPEGDFGWEENDFKYMPKKVDREKWRVGDSTFGS